MQDPPSRICKELLRGNKNKADKRENSEQRPERAVAEGHQVNRQGFPTVVPMQRRPRPKWHRCTPGSGTEVAANTDVGVGQAAPVLWVGVRLAHPLEKTPGGVRESRGRAFQHGHPRPTPGMSLTLHPSPPRPQPTQLSITSGVSRNGRHIRARGSVPRGVGDRLPTERKEPTQAHTMSLSLRGAGGRLR